MSTVTLYSMIGFSKAKTAKAILFFDPATNREAWMPLSVAIAKFIGPDFKVKVTVPGWFFGKISWKTLPTPKVDNPYIGQCPGNLGEELMVLQEMNDDQPSENLLSKINMIKEALALVA